MATADLSAAETRAIRDLLFVAFGSDEDEAFTEDDWQHAIGGRHFVLEIGGRIVAHASVVERVIRVARQPLRTGYVEAVATEAEHQGQGLGSRLMEEVDRYIREDFELGVLGTGRHHFYERLGWRTWRGPSSVLTAEGSRPTPDEDGYILVLATPHSPPLDLDDAISCEWRPGDVW